MLITNAELALRVSTLNKESVKVLNVIKSSNLNVYKKQ